MRPTGSSPAIRIWMQQRLGVATGDPETVEEVLAWFAAERTLGDPGPHAPVVVDYPATGQRIVFAATHDGLLHAFDAGSGVENWAWLPHELLPRLVRLMRDEPTTVRDHGIDGPLVLHRFDPDGDGHIDAAAGEHLWLLFGLGRGGNRYYALDISSADDPRLAWSIALPGAAGVESRAAPVVTRLAIAESGQSAGDWVVLLAGGYDRQFDSIGAVRLRLRQRFARAGRSDRPDAVAERQRSRRGPAGLRAHRKPAVRAPRARSRRRRASRSRLPGGHRRGPVALRFCRRPPRG